MAAECVGEFTVYKRAGSPHYIVIRVKTSFCSATYRPKAHRPIYRDLGALVHSKYLHHSVRHNALIVGTWSRSSSLRVDGRTTKRGHCEFVRSPFSAFLTVARTHCSTV